MSTKTNPSPDAGSAKHTPTIKFIREERVCGHNQNPKLRDHKIYDFRVMIDGEHRATFTSKVYHRGYDLIAPVPGRFKRIKRTDERDRQWPIDVSTRAEFQKTIDAALTDGLIPTVAGLAELKSAADQAKRDEAKEIEKQQRAECIRMAAPDLYAALKLFANGHIDVSETAVILGYERTKIAIDAARAAIAKAEHLG